jgi:hypothetical protein
MSVTVQTKDVGDVKDVYLKESAYKKTLEDRNEDYIKKSMGDLQ